MKYLILLVLTIASMNSWAKELEIGILRPDTIVEDPTLNSSAMVYFKFPNANAWNDEIVDIDYSIDDEVGKFIVTETNNSAIKAFSNSLSAKLEPGYHQLQFYFNSDYSEVYTSINIEAGKHYYYSVYFNPSPMPVMTEKPVIYLYPEKEKDISVKVNPTGDFTFTYPTYNNGWNVKASPNGDLKIGNETYKYLFWESSEKLSKDAINSNEGFVVAGTNVIGFLEEKLTTMGLTSEEQADFITFWGPRMIQHSDVFVQFRFNESCDAFATLDITPKPDAINRVYIIWQPVDQLRIAPKAQIIPTFDRSGFNVLEWGGQELPSIQQIRSL